MPAQRCDFAQLYVLSTIGDFYIEKESEVEVELVCYTFQNEKDND